MGKEALFGGGLAVCYSGLVAGGGQVSMGGMAVRGDNAHARTREENLRTKQFFFLTQRVISFLCILPRHTASILPSAPNASDAVSACHPSEHLYMCHPSHILTSRTRAHTHVPGAPIPMTPIGTPATATATSNQTTHPTTPNCVKTCHT